MDQTSLRKLALWANENCLPKILRCESHVNELSWIPDIAIKSKALVDYGIVKAEMIDLERARLLYYVAFAYQGFPSENNCNESPFGQIVRVAEIEDPLLPELSTSQEMLVPGTVIYALVICHSKEDCDISIGSDSFFKELTTN
ncbi:unnamed protein product [Blepharisma stoltei]|uniref:Uncharacterized protein n=1 Tax=Blepharisma stoltei TaxID=1481888 RepID=A0AAU9K6H4_9CILI|nr:unnamed protein product [Blepharisma stoltei]